MDWLEVLQNLGIAGVLIAAVTWLTQHLVKHYLDKNVETHKAKLRADANKEIEFFKNALQQTSIEHEIRFTRLHNKRADVIAETYRLVNQLREKLVDAMLNISEASTFEERYSRFTDTLGEFRRYSGANQIYLEAELCEKVSSLADELWKIGYVCNSCKSFFDDKKAVQQSVHGLVSNTRVEVNDPFRKALNDLTKNVDPVRKALEMEFRDIMGVTKPNKPAEVEK